MLEYLSRETSALLLAAAAAAALIGSKVCLFHAFDARRFGANSAERNREPAWGLTSVALRYAAWAAGVLALVSFVLNLLRMARQP